MQRIDIVDDEHYPVYTAHRTPNDLAAVADATLTDEEWADYQRVVREFESWQRTLCILQGQRRCEDG